MCVTGCVSVALCDWWSLPGGKHVSLFCFFFFSVPLTASRPSLPRPPGAGGGVREEGGGRVSKGSQVSWMVAEMGHLARS